MSPRRLPCEERERNEASKCNACARAIDLNERIREAERLMDRLKAERLALDADMNQHHDLLTRRLPPELVSCIFRFTLPEDIDTCPNNDAVLLLDNICRRWREVARSTPYLWASVACEVGQPLAQEWIRRSGQLPLCLKVTSSTRSSKTTLPQPVQGSHWRFNLSDTGNLWYKDVNASSPRWRILILRVTSQDLECFHGSLSGAPLLEELSIVRMKGNHLGNPFSYLSIQRRGIRSPPGPFSFLGEAPRLRQVHGIKFSFVSVQIDWGNITHVRLDEMCPAEILLLFDQATRMVQCKLYDIKSTQMPTLQPPQHIVHSTLERLEITVSIGVNLQNLLAALTLPSLKRCRGFGAEILPLLLRSSCSLTHFEFDQPRTIGHLMGIVASIPSLEEISILDHDDQSENFLKHAIQFLLQDTPQFVGIRIRTLEINYYPPFPSRSVAFLSTIQVRPGFHLIRFVRRQNLSAYVSEGDARLMHPETVRDIRDVQEKTGVTIAVCDAEGHDLLA